MMCTLGYRIFTLKILVSRLSGAMSTWPKVMKIDGATRGSISWCLSTGFLWVGWEQYEEVELCGANIVHRHRDHRTTSEDIRGWFVASTVIHISMRWYRAILILTRWLAPNFISVASLSLMTNIYAKVRPTKNRILYHFDQFNTHLWLWHVGSVRHFDTDGQWPWPSKIFDTQ